MHIPEAKQFLGRNVSVTYRDRHGDLHTKTLHVHDVSFVPMYGGCLVGDIDDIWLEGPTPKLVDDFEVCLGLDEMGYGPSLTS